MIENFDYQEDVAALLEPVFDIDEHIYWELDLEYGFKE